MGRRKRRSGRAGRAPAEAGTAFQPVGQWRFLMLPAVVAVAAAVLMGGLWLADLITGSGPAGPSAVIVDQLSLTYPNPAFAEAATETLEEAGHRVEYFAGEQVTVDLYRSLPRRGYDLILLRAHSGRIRTEDLSGLT